MLQVSRCEPVGHLIPPSTDARVVLTVQTPEATPLRVSVIWDVAFSDDAVDLCCLDAPAGVSAHELLLPTASLPTHTLTNFACLDVSSQAETVRILFSAAYANSTDVSLSFLSCA